MPTPASPENNGPPSPDPLPLAKQLDRDETTGEPTLDALIIAALIRALKGN